MLKYFVFSLFFLVHPAQVYIRYPLYLSLVLSVIFLLLIILILVKLYRSDKALTKARKKLFHLNQKLQESNRIKEVYISHFLNLYSDHLDKVDECKKYIVRQLNAGHPNEVIKKEIMQTLDTKNDLNGFFSDFDRSILELFPSFIEDVNALLKSDQVYIMKNDDLKTVKLNTELRILALLRLNISDNKEIASFFRFTVQTVYNYRSKLRSRAINESTFEEDVKRICSFGVGHTGEL